MKLNCKVGKRWRLYLYKSPGFSCQGCYFYSHTCFHPKGAKGTDAKGTQCYEKEHLHWRKEEVIV